MYKPLEIAKDVFYVGVNDRSKHFFENMWPLPYGVSYNAYLVTDEKTALIDTVDICYSDIFFHKIQSVLGDKPIDFLVVNHMEPDHSGSIAWLVAKYPGIRIIGNKRTADMLKGYYGITGNVIQIEDLEELSLGSTTLQFHMTPMVHWPETMMTYLPEKKTLFSADAFGTFGTLDGGVMDRQLNPERYRDEMIRYYSNIVGKFGSPVQTALKKLSGLEIDVLCSTHGPVWTRKENITDVIALYDKLSRYEAGKRSSSWVKVKAAGSAEFVIGGYTKGRGSRAPLGALLVGTWEGGRLRYASHAGTKPAMDWSSLTEACTAIPNSLPRS